MIKYMVGRDGDRRHETQRLGSRETHLRFAHDLAVGPDPDDQDELLALGLLVVRVLYARVRVRRLAVVELVAQFREPSRSGRGQLQLVRAVRLRVA